MKRYPTLTFFLTMALLLVACGKDKKTSEPTVTHKASEPFAAAKPNLNDQNPPLVHPEQPQAEKPDCAKTPDDPACKKNEPAIPEPPQNPDFPPKKPVEPQPQPQTPPEQIEKPDTRPDLGKPKEEDRPKLPTEITPRPVDQELRLAQEIAKNAIITCKDNDCNASVGMLSMVMKDANGWGAGRCTASLIAPDIIATNAHCVPADLTTPGADCHDRLWLTFPDDPSHPGYDKQMGCGKMLFQKMEQYGFEGYDLAYFQLERSSNRPVLRSSREGFADGAFYEVQKVNPVRSLKAASLTGEFEKVKCRAVFDSRMFSAPLTAMDKGVLLADCPIIRGNSGSPVLAADGSMRGVIYAQVDIDRVRTVFNKHGSTTVPPALLSLASNFACLPDPGDLAAGNLPEACRTYDRVNVRAKFAGAFGAKTLEQAQKLVDSQKDGASELRAFGWAAAMESSDTYGVYALGIPVCARPDLADGLVSQRSSIRRPVFFVKANYDKYFRESNPELIWGDWQDPADILEVVKSGPGYRVRLNNSKSGQLEWTGLLKGCQR